MFESTQKFFDDQKRMQRNVEHVRDYLLDLFTREEWPPQLVIMTCELQWPDKRFEEVNMEKEMAGLADVREVGSPRTAFEMYEAVLYDRDEALVGV